MIHCDVISAHEAFVFCLPEYIQICMNVSKFIMYKFVPCFKAKTAVGYQMCEKAEKMSNNSYAPSKILQNYVTLIVGVILHTFFIMHVY